ncbi:protein of unknown function (plasmid) [Cupriavidus taiwanensis]|uniref:Uncharacterized protein n=1 Tax=Cupriavidus taiwanensis TaxID=164546 RepID=A0A375EDP9_9BURK|nr:protein of unknown function [Cupriavidus taiwanensis]
MSQRSGRTPCLRQMRCTSRDRHVVSSAASFWVRGPCARLELSVEFSTRASNSSGGCSGRLSGWLACKQDSRSAKNRLDHRVIKRESQPGRCMIVSRDVAIVTQKNRLQASRTARLRVAACNCSRSDSVKFIFPCTQFKYKLVFFQWCSGLVAAVYRTHCAFMTSGKPTTEVRSKRVKAAASVTPRRAPVALIGALRLTLHEAQPLQ